MKIEEITKSNPQIDWNKIAIEKVKLQTPYDPYCCTKWHLRYFCSKCGANHGTKEAVLICGECGEENSSEKIKVKKQVITKQIFKNRWFRNSIEVSRFRYITATNHHIFQSSNWAFKQTGWPFDMRIMNSLEGVVTIGASIIILSIGIIFIMRMFGVCG